MNAAPAVYQIKFDRSRHRVMKRDSRVIPPFGAPNRTYFGEIYDMVANVRRIADGGDQVGKIYAGSTAEIEDTKRFVRLAFGCQKCCDQRQQRTSPPQTR
jgi:hypothetical protein